MTTLKVYKPLIISFLIVILVTAYVVAVTADTSYMFAGRWFMGMFFLVFGGLKVLRPTGFATAFAKYDLLAKYIPGYAYIYPYIEVGLGIAFLLSWELFAMNIVTIVISVVGAISVAIALVNKLDLTCGCLGTVYKVPLTWVTLGENLLMLIMAIAMLTVL